jgi:hypothetical protein
MPLKFHRAIETMEIWSAKSDGYSFVISYESLPVAAFADAPVIWRHGVRLMKAMVQSGSPVRHLKLLTRPKPPAMRCYDERKLTR